MESHFKMDVHVEFNEIEVKRAEERRMERERHLAEEATQKNKGVIDDTQEAGGSSSQPEIGGSSNQEDIEMVEAVDVQEQENIQEQIDQDFMMVGDAENVQEHVDQDFMMVGESSEPLDAENVLRKVFVFQRKRKAREMLLLEWKTDQFVLVGNAYPVPYNVHEVAREMKVKERRRKAKKARGEIVDDDSDVELFGDDDEENEDDNDENDDKPDDHNDKDNKGDDDDDQGASGLLIKDPIVQERINELMNDEINEQEDDVQNEASSLGKQHADQVFLSNPTIIYLNVP
ncbi:histone chaperone ASF1-like [Helianthus annuus]|uniref:histone chaperone ASF1-like n=1 Tax=Helianthus annuus TaxID=4232 RepID=UPI000B8F2899|nr:histone chaperone ASF1-like [Helianthus annuus]